MNFVSDEVKTYMQQYELSDEQLMQLDYTFRRDIINTLNPALSAQYKSSMKMIPTFMSKFPTGHETGYYLGVDMGGSNLRVLSVTLKGSHMKYKYFGKTVPNKPEINQMKWTIPQPLRTSTATQLFDFIGKCIETFVKSHNIQSKKPIPLGFTFSYPCIQSKIDEAYLVEWGKGFNIPDMFEKNVVAVLQEAVDSLQLNIKVVALLNDTTGVLISMMYQNTDAAIGVIMGTGTNACYMENISEIKHHNLTPEMAGNAKTMIINTEWGAFGENGELDSIRTNVDKELDEESVNAHKQVFEKLLSGMYLGEIVRKVILDMVKTNVIQDDVADKMMIPYSFQTIFFSSVFEDGANGITKTQYMLRSFLGAKKTISPTFCHLVKHVCKTIMFRSARLTAVALNCLLDRIDSNKVEVAVDGSLFVYQPQYYKCVEEKLSAIGRPDRRVKLIRCDDGSGLGAVYAAAALSQ
ncbi:hypothetical protein SNEBB_006978 [Seison nebaliae]|nr:hypothetical protein SNEBB_006978 [Seison nebaliae]